MENSKKVLFVDDDVLFATSVGYIIKGLYNIEIDIAASPSEAYNKIKSKKFDIVFCDTEMPEMFGYELKERLDKEKIEIPFIGMSSDEKYENKWKNLGCDFIQKGDKFYRQLKCVLESD